MQVSRPVMLRYLTSLAMAMAVTTALVWVMQFLIKSDRLSLDESPNTLPVSWFPSVKDEPIVRIKLPQKIEDPLPPPPTEIVVAMGDPEIIWSGGPVTPGPGIKDLAIEGATFDSAPLPIVRVQPEYPARALTRGIEGYVVVEFTITTAGGIENARVVEAQPSGIFDRSALRAVQRYKYKPRVSGGIAHAVEGVLHRIVFELSDS